MDGQMTAGVALAAGIGGVGLLTGGFQVRGLRRLAARRHVPSDEFAYLRNRHRRRLVTASLLLVIAALIGGAYLSGMEARADALGEHNAAAPDPDGRADGKKPEMAPDDKRFVKFWGLYWIAVVVLVFGLFVLALTDAIASRRFWMAQFRSLRDEHQTKLRRDLAVHRTQAIVRGRKRLGRLDGNGNDADDAGE